MNENKLADFILKNIFVISKQPVLFRDLLEANCLFNEGMLVDPSKLNFKFKYLNTYLVYGIICLVASLFLIATTHSFFEKLDFHLSILSTIFATSVIFIGFDMFKIWARKSISKKLIKEAWIVHFPYFSYEKYSSKVEMIYNQAMKNEISRKNLEQYVLEHLIAQNESNI
ncbi:MAG: hypothetical protein ACTTJC_00290 [Campylobacter sp.]